MPSHFFAGRDVRTMGVRFLIELREEIGQFPGRRRNTCKPIFELETSTAIGRLAMIMTARFCPDTVDAALTESSFSFSGEKVGFMPLTAGDLIVNPRAWRHLSGGNDEKISEFAKRAVALNGDGKNYLLFNLGETARKDKEDFLTQCASDFCYSVAFGGRIWFSPYAEAEALSARWKSAPAGLKKALPNLFQPISQAELDIASRVAARMLPAALPVWQDPNCRKSDAQRAIVPDPNGSQ